MNMILLFTSILMWVLAILTAICLLRLLRETNKLEKELEEQRKELETVEVCVYRDMKKQNGWHAVLCTDEMKGENEDGKDDVDGGEVRGCNLVENNKLSVK